MNLYGKSKVLKEFVDQYTVDTHVIGYCLNKLKSYGIDCRITSAYILSNHDDLPASDRFICITFTLNKAFRVTINNVDFVINLEDNEKIFKTISNELTKLFPNDIIPLTSPCIDKGKVIIEVDTKKELTLYIAETSVDTKYCK